MVGGVGRLRGSAARCGSRLGRGDRQRGVTANGVGGPLAPHAFGTPLCQDAAGRVVLGLVVAGPGRGLSEEPAVGCEPVALESESLPLCPPGPVVVCPARSSSIALYTRSDRRRLRQRSASIDVLPPAFFRS